MGTIVTDIHAKIQSLAQTELTSTWSPMRRVFDPSQNNRRNGEKVFGVLHGAAPSDDESGTFRFYSVDHEFTILLQKIFVDRLDDSNKQDEINDIYDNVDKLIKKFTNSKLELPTKVTQVFLAGIAEPEEFSENSSVVVRFSINVKYRQAL